MSNETVLLTRNDARFLLGFVGPGAMGAAALQAVIDGRAVVVRADALIGLLAAADGALVKLDELRFQQDVEDEADELRTAIAAWNCL